MLGYRIDSYGKGTVFIIYFKILGRGVCLLVDTLRENLKELASSKSIYLLTNMIIIIIVNKNNNINNNRLAYRDKTMEVQ